MPDFDPDAYFRNKLAGVDIDAKLAEVKAASDAKLATLASGKPEPVRVNQFTPTNPLDTAQDMAIKLAQGVVDFGQSAVGLGSLVTGGLVGKGMRSIGYDPEQTNQFLGQYLSPEQQAADDTVNKAQGFKNTLLTALDHPLSIAGSVAESLPGMVAGMGAPALVAERIAAKAALSTVEGQLAAQAASKVGQSVAKAALATQAGAKAAQVAIDAAEVPLMGVGAATEGAQSAGQIADQSQGMGRDYADYALPSIAAGVGTGLINMAAQHTMGSAVTDMATGTHTLKGNLLTKLAKEGFSEGVMEELPQSAQEQVFTNIAQGKQWDEGVGNAAATGLLAGAAMGAGMGGLHGDHAAHTAETPAGIPLTPSKGVEKAEIVANAQQTGDISGLLDKNSPHYDPTEAMSTLFKANSDPQSTPEDRINNIQQGIGIIQHLGSVEQDLYNQLKSSDKTEVETAKQQITALNQHLEGSQKVLDQMVDDHLNATAPEDVSKVVEQANAPAEQDSNAAQDAAHMVINLSMVSPSYLSTEQARTLADNLDNALTDDQRKYLRTFSDARVLENQLSSMDKVSQEILHGSAKNVGIDQYRTRVGQAILADNQEAAQKQLTQLGSFTQAMVDKAQVARQAIAQGLGTQIVKTTHDGWKIQPKGTMDDAQLRTNGGLALNSPKLVAAFQTQAAALQASHAEMSQAVALHFQGTPLADNAEAPVQSSTPTPAPTTLQSAPPVSPSVIEENTVPQGNISTQENVEDKARLERDPLQTVAKTPQAPTQDTHTGNKKEDQTREIEGAEFSISSPARSATPSPASSLADARSSQDGAPTLAEKLQQSEAEQQASASAESAVAEASTAAEEDKVTVDSLGLAAQRTPDGEQRAYQDQNLIADYFDIRPGSEDGTQRPLAKIKDFLSAVLADPKLISSFIKTAWDDITPSQNNALTIFVKAAQDWSKTIAENVVKRKDPKFYFKDVMQFLIDEKGNLPENAMTAISYGAFRSIVDMERAPQVNDDKAINAMLGREEDTLVDDFTRDTLARIGQRESMLMNSIGDVIYQSLGFKTKATTPINLPANLKSALGAYAVKLMLDKGILKRTEIPGKVMAQIMGNGQTNSNASFKFLALAKGENGKLNTAAQQIVDASQGSKSIVDKLFGVEPSTTAPSDVPLPFTQKTTSTGQVVPSKEATLLDKENQSPWHLNQDLWHLMNQMGEENILPMAGAKPVDTSVHKFRRLGLEAKNNGLLREIRNMFDFFTGRPVDAPMYFQNDVWSQQRVGIKNNLINPQSSKVHRNILFRPEWEARIDVHDTEAVNTFLMQVAAGLGIKTEKQLKQKSLDEVNNKLSSDEVYNAIQALRKVINRQDLTEEDKQAIIDGTGFGGENFHSLASLMAVARYQEAVENGEDHFISQMVAEVDGVTNGPMLTHAWMGAASSVSGLFDLLNKGGFYSVDSPTTQYNLWRAVAGHFDLYETTAGHMMDHMADLLKQGITDKWGKVKVSPARVQALSEALYFFTGTLKEGDKIVKAGRDIIKTPLTAMVFGSSVPNSVDSMADRFVEGIYGKIEDLSQMDDLVEQEAQRKTLVQNLDTLGIGLPAQITVEHLMESTFTPQEVNTLKSQFSSVIGEAVKRTMNTDFADFLAQRKAFNDKAQVTFQIYDAAYRAVRESFIQELVDSGAIASRVTQNGVKEALHDLTAEQQRELDKRMAGLFPVMGTAFSEESKQPDAGLPMTKSTRVLSQDSLYSNTVEFAKPFKDVTGKVETTPKGEPIRRVTTHGFAQQNAAPGVGMLVKGIHAGDAYISMHAGEVVPSGNNHDARTSGVHLMTDLATAMNHATWKALLSYSPATALANTLSQVIQGLPKLLDRSGKVLQTTIISNLAEVVKGIAEKAEIPSQSVLDMMLGDARAAALQADTMKLSFLEQLGHIDQYAMEGGHYAVTDTDRAAATTAKDQLQVGLTKQEQKALATLAATLTAHLESKPATAEAPAATQAPKPGAPTALPGQGLAKNASNQTLVNALRKQPVMTVKEIAKVLRGVIKDETYRMLLSQLERTIPEAIKIHFVTPETDPGSLVWGPNHDTARGWYAHDTQTGERAIYVLSPEFVHSGLTDELLLHEMTHAALLGIVNAKNKSPDVQALVDELRDLLKKARGFIASAPHLKGKNWAVENLDELIAYGMSNQGFRDNVLKQIEMSSKTGSNRLVTAMKKFIDTITALVFGRPNQRMSTGLDVLIQNVAGLFEATAQQGDNLTNEQGGSRSMAAPLNQLNTTDLYEALGQTSNTQVSPEFDTKLRSVLDSIVAKIHGAYGAFAAHTTSTLTTPLDVWAEAVVSGKAPFAAKVLASGFTFSDQEAFVAEQVEATLRAVMADKDGSTTAAYRELATLYNDARDNLKTRIAEFHPDPVVAQQLYDFAFKIDTGTGDQSDYLARFAALGMANEQFNKLLQFSTPIKSDSLAGLSFSEKLHAVFERILNWVHGKLTHTYAGQAGDTKLTTLVQQLVNIQDSKRNKLAQSPLVMTEMIEDGFRTAAAKMRSGAEKLGQSPFFKQHTNGIVRMTGRIVTAVATDRVGQLVDALQTFRDTHLKEKNGVLMGLVNEVRGPAHEMFSKLLRVSKYIEGVRKDIISNVSKVALDSFKDGGKYLSKEMKRAISAVLLRTDVASLLSHFDMTGIHKLLTDTQHLDSQIAHFEGQLNQFSSAHSMAYMNLASVLAYRLATGRVTSRNILMNADNIARLYGTDQAGRISDQQAKDAAKIIDPLTTLYALKYSDRKMLKQAAEVMHTEAGRTDGGNGVEMILKLHQHLQQDSAERLFNTSGALRMKGYTTEIYNPYIKMVVADASTDGKDLVAQGYSESTHSLKRDQGDPDMTSGSDQRIYTLRDGGMISHLTGIISYTGQRNKGSKINQGKANPYSVTGMINQDRMGQVAKMNVKAARELFTQRIDPTKVTDALLAPVLNAEGKVVNYRYMMEEHTKDSLLERNNNFDTILGAMAGNIYDKEQTREQNARAIQALYDQYRQDFASNPASYVRVGPNSTDPEMREIWALLPEVTKQSIRTIWGNNNMMVRYDLLDLNFGYRKLSLTDPFGIPPEERGRFEKLYVEFFQGILRPMGKEAKAELYLRRFEDIWQALVREAKDTMVVKSGLTLMGNFTSNVSELIWFGVPMTDIVKHHRVAFKGIMAFRKDSAELADLELKLKSNYQGGADKTVMQQRVLQLKDALARNPVRELVESGMLPTIVEDSSQEDDQYSFKGRMTQKVDDFLGNLNPHVLEAGKLLTMAHDTPIYKALSYGTQVSDFIARYTLYQYVTNRDKNQMGKDQALQLISDAFVNYDIPSHRTVQYANDMGLVYFSKYYLRIQKVIALLYRQNPGRALMLLTAGHFLDFVPILTHSSALHRFGNPFSMGAFDAVSSLDEMATVNALMSPFR